MLAASLWMPFEQRVVKNNKLKGKWKEEEIFGKRTAEVGVLKKKQTTDDRKSVVTSQSFGELYGSFIQSDLYLLHFLLVHSGYTICFCVSIFLLVLFFVRVFLLFFSIFLLNSSYEFYPCLFNGLFFPPMYVSLVLNYLLVILCLIHN